MTTRKVWGRWFRSPKVFKYYEHDAKYRGWRYVQHTYRNGVYGLHYP